MKNLISGSTLENKGFKISFIDEQAYLWPKEKGIQEDEAIGICEGGLYKLTGYPIQALVQNTANNDNLWHRRFAHLFDKALTNLHHMVRGLPHISLSENEVCKGCLPGKNTKKSFNSNESRPKDILELIHSDICGPMSVESITGSSYFVTFIDDYSKKTWIYLLKTKAEVFSRF